MNYNFMNNLKEKTMKTTDTAKMFIRKKMYYVGLTSEKIRKETSKNTVRGKIIDVDVQHINFSDAYTQDAFLHPLIIIYHIGLYTGENIIIDSVNDKIEGKHEKGNEVNITIKKYDVMKRDYTVQNLKEKRVVSVSSLEELAMAPIKKE